MNDKKMLEGESADVESDDVVQILRARLDSLDAGEVGIPAEEVLDNIRETLGIEKEDRK